MEEPLTTRYSLILRLRDPADAAAWNEFAALYEPLVYRLARHKGLQDADARDLCQDVLLAVARAVGRWQPDPARGSFRGWLARIARNLLINFLARHHELASGSSSVQELLEAQPVADKSATTLFEAEYRRRVLQWAADQVKREFAATTWTAFWRSTVEGQTPKAVAADLRISVGAVYIARSRVMARLRKTIEQLDGQALANIVSEVEHGTASEPVRS